MVLQNQLHSQIDFVSFPLALIFPATIHIPLRLLLLIILRALHLFLPWPIWITVVYIASFFLFIAPARIIKRVGIHSIFTLGMEIWVVFSSIWVCILSISTHMDIMRWKSSCIAPETLLLRLFLLLRALIRIIVTVNLETANVPLEFRFKIGRCFLIRAVKSPHLARIFVSVGSWRVGWIIEIIVFLHFFGLLSRAHKTFFQNSPVPRIIDNPRFRDLISPSFLERRIISVSGHFVWSLAPIMVEGTPRLMARSMVVLVPPVWPGFYSISLFMLGTMLLVVETPLIISSIV